MARKIKIDDNTYECPACNYRWSKTMGMADLSFDEDVKRKQLSICLREPRRRILLHV